MRYQMIALSLGLIGVTLIASPARGQRHGGSVFVHAGRPAATVSRGGAVGGRFVRMRGGRRAVARSGPNYYPYYFSDYSSDYNSQDETAQAPPAAFRVQPAAPMPAANSPKPPESLVMELRGDHWIRLTSFGPMETAAQSSEPQAERANGPVQAKVPVPSEQAQGPSEPPAVLIFRDGHQEQAAKYTIIGTTIWIKTDYWSTGSWTRKIAVSDLNLAATLQANHERGAKFSLPSRPSEVIVR
jgi:hypothetical protein